MMRWVSFLVSWDDLFFNLWGGSLMEVNGECFCIALVYKCVHESCYGPIRKGDVMKKTN